MDDLRAPLPPYLAVTAAHDESLCLEATLASVMGQAHPPRRWVVVDDRSRDDTAAIIERWARRYPCLTLIRREKDERPAGFAFKVQALQIGMNALAAEPDAYLALIDADVHLPAHFFPVLLARMERDARLGITGGWVYAMTPMGFMADPDNRIREVAGCAQLVRRAAYEQAGGMLPLPHGGEDTALVVAMRLAGWRARAWPDLPVLHLKPTGLRQGSRLLACWQEGLRAFDLGYRLDYFLLRSLWRWRSPPIALGSLTAFLAFLAAMLSQGRPLLPQALCEHLRAAQARRMQRLFSCQRGSIDDEGGEDGCGPAGLHNRQEMPAAGAPQGGPLRQHRLSYPQPDAPVCDERGGWNTMASHREREDAGPAPRKPRILAISSGGGHWAEMRRLSPALEGMEVVYATLSIYCREVEPEARFYPIVYATKREPLQLLWLFCQILWLLLRERPHAVITTGAACGFIAVFLGRLLGMRTIWLDSIANAEQMSLSGKLAGRFAHLWLTQWKHLARPQGPFYVGTVL